MSSGWRSHGESQSMGGDKEAVLEQQVMYEGCSCQGMKIRRAFGIPQIS
jgi:hypothetical protein